MRYEHLGIPLLLLSYVPGIQWNPADSELALAARASKSPVCQIRGVSNLFNTKQIGRAHV